MTDRKNVLATAVLFAAMSMMVVSATGCGTQYGGKPSSIPRDVDSDDATTAQPQSTDGSQNRTAPTGTGSTGTGTSGTSGTGTRR